MPDRTGQRRNLSDGRVCFPLWEEVVFMWTKVAFSSVARKSCWAMSRPTV